MTVASPDSTSPTPVAEWSVEPEQYGRFLCAIFDEWVRHDVGSTFVQLFDVSLGIWALGHSSLCVFEPTCGRALAIEHNGDLYACDHYVFPGFRRGNIDDEPLAALVESEDAAAVRPRQARHASALLPSSAPSSSPVAASVRRRASRRHRTANGGLNYLCAGYRRFFASRRADMEFMKGELAQRKPPANVMAWIAAHDRRAGAREPGRNDPCRAAPARSSSGAAARGCDHVPAQGTARYASPPGRSSQTVRPASSSSIGRMR